MNKFLDFFNDLVHVPKCAGCGIRMSRSNDGICEECKRKYLDERDEYCDFCGMSARLCTCIPHNMMINGCIDYRKLIFYRKQADAARVRNMIYAVKRKYNKALISFFAKELVEQDKGALPTDAIITFAPRMQKSVKKYGYDQGKLLAESYAKQGEYRFKTLISRKQRFRQSQQKLLNYSQRLSNIRGMFTVYNEEFVKGKHIVIIDDVVTSGATLGECVSVLYAAGARSVTCRSIAHTYRKNKQKND